MSVSQRRVSLIALAVVALLGVTYLAYPFAGDQAFFTLGALRMHDGGVLYRDFWDIKQPGIFAFYFIAGSLFGFNETGVHLFECFYLLAFSFVLQRTLSREFEHAWIASITPLLIVGWYYVVAGYDGFTQVEALVGFPLYVSLWCCLRGFERAGNAAFLLVAAGIAASLVAAYKLLYVVVVLAVWGTAVFTHRTAPNALRRCALLVCAFAVSAACIWVWCASLAGASLLSYTFFTLPALIVQLPSPPITRLVHAFVWYAESAAPLIALAAMGLISTRRSRDPVVMAALAWLVAGCAALIAQRQSWWAYQTMLLSVPVGLLAAKGLDALRGRQNVAAIVLSLCALPYGWKLAHAFRELARYRFAITANAAAAYRESINPLYGAARDDASFLKTRSVAPGDIYVLGNPLYYLAADRRQATAMNGWSPELFTAREWHALSEELARRVPPYVFISNQSQALVDRRSAAVERVLVMHYRVLRHTPRAKRGTPRAIHSGALYLKKRPSRVQPFRS